MSRKRGAQPGNNNALKHGFYSDHMRSGDVVDLEAMSADGLTDEIGMMRVLIRRLFEYAEKEEAQEIGTWLDVLDAAGMAFARLSGLIRTQKILTGGGSDVASALSEALKEVTSELKC